MMSPAMKSQGIVPVMGDNGLWGGGRSERHALSSAAEWGDGVRHHLSSFS